MIQQPLGRHPVAPQRVPAQHGDVGAGPGHPGKIHAQHRQFPRRIAGTHPDPAAQQQAAAGAGAQHDHRTVFHVGESAVPRLGAHRALAVVGDGHRRVQAVRQQAGHGCVLDKGEDAARMGNAAGGVDAAGHGHRRAGILPGKFCTDGRDGRQQCVHALLRRGDLALLQDRAVLPHQGIFDESAANVQYQIPLHRDPPFFLRCWFSVAGNAQPAGAVILLFIVPRNRAGCIAENG